MRLGEEEMKRPFERVIRRNRLAVLHGVYGFGINSVRYKSAPHTVGVATSELDRPAVPGTCLRQLDDVPVCLVGP